MADRFHSRPKQSASNFGHGSGGGGGQDTPEADPLAELARLIGQTDPNSSFVRGQPARTQEQAAASDFTPGAPSWLQTAQAHRHHDVYARQYADHHDAQQEDAEPELTPMPSFLRAGHQNAEQSHYDGVLYGEEQRVQSYDDQYDQDGAYQGEEYAADDALDQPPAFLNRETKRPRRGGMLTVGVVLGLAVVGTASAYAYRSYVGSPRSGTPPIVKAESTPTKVVPPAAQSGDNSGKLIYDRIANADGPERVVSREEQPVDVNAAGSRSVFPPPPRQGTALSQPLTQPMASPSQSGVPASPDEPRRIRTVPIRGDQSAATPQMAAAAKPAPGPAAPPRPAAQAAASTAPSGNGPMALTPNNVRAASASAPVQPAPVSPTRGGYVVQIASQKSEAEAQASYKAAQAKYSSLLGSSSPIIKRADLGDKGVYYRAMVGPFASQEEAGQLCSNLKVAGGQCVVQRN